MTADKISQTVVLPDLFDKPLVSTFDREQASRDGGGVPLKAVERVYECRQGVWRLSRRQARAAEDSAHRRGA